MGTVPAIRCRRGPDTGPTRSAVLVSEKLGLLHVGTVCDHSAWDPWVPPFGPLRRGEAVQTGLTGLSLGQVPDPRKCTQDKAGLGLQAKTEPGWDLGESIICGLRWLSQLTKCAWASHPKKYPLLPNASRLCTLMLHHVSRNTLCSLCSSHRDDNRTCLQVCREADA